MADSIQLISRTFTVLDVLSRSDAPLQLAAIAASASLPKSTTHRILGALVAEGHVRDHGTGQYSVGGVHVALWARVLRGGILSQAGPVAREMREETGFTVYVGALDGLELIYLHRLPGLMGPQSDVLHTMDGAVKAILFGLVGHQSDVGHAGQAQCSCLGKAILAYMPEETVRAYLQEYDLVQRTIFSIKSPKVLLADLEATRERGYATCDEEYTVGICAIGAPLFDYSGRCVAAISLATFKEHYDRLKAQAPLLIKAARAISERMGYVPESTVL